MGTTTFSGPVKAGTVREGASVNTGFVLMSQSAVIDIIGATNTTTSPLCGSRSLYVTLSVSRYSPSGKLGSIEAPLNQINH